MRVWRKDNQREGNGKPRYHRVGACWEKKSDSRAEIQESNLDSASGRRGKVSPCCRSRR